MLLFSNSTEGEGDDLSVCATFGTLNAGKFFQGHVRPRLPEAKGMGTDNAPPTVLGMPISEQTADQVSGNIQVSIVRSF